MENNVAKKTPSVFDSTKLTTKAPRLNPATTKQNFWNVSKFLIYFYIISLPHLLQQIPDRLGGGWAF